MENNKETKAKGVNQHFNRLFMSRRRKGGKRKSYGKRRKQRVKTSYLVQRGGIRI